MGRAKAEMGRLEDLRSVAEGVAIRAGAVSACPRHSDTILSNDDQAAEKQAYAIGTNMVKAGEIDGTREEFMTAIKAVIGEAGDECPSCAKWRND